MGEKWPSPVCRSVLREYDTTRMRSVDAHVLFSASMNWSLVLSARVATQPGVCARVRMSADRSTRRRVVHVHGHLHCVGVVRRDLQAVAAAEAGKLFKGDALLLDALESGITHQTTPARPG